MRDLFPGYYRPTTEQFRQMWQECIFSLDANALLHIYRYSSETREELLNIYDQLKDRIWLTNQAVLEYHKNREDVISQQHSISDEIEAALKEVSNKIEAKYKRGHPFADTNLITKIIKMAIQKIKASIEDAQSKYPDLLVNDLLLERITDLFDGRVGKQFAPKRLEEIYKEFEQRYKLLIPPGYKDKKLKREDFEKYGDGVLWCQLIDYAKEQKKPIILITDDTKEDWWRIEKGKTIGPRPEIIEEMRSKGGVAFYLYNVSQFMKYAKEFLGIQVQQIAIDEVRDVEQQDKTLYPSTDLLPSSLLYPVALLGAWKSGNLIRDKHIAALKAALNSIDTSAIIPLLVALVANSETPFDSLRAALLSTGYPEVIEHAPEIPLSSENDKEALGSSQGSQEDEKQIEDEEKQEDDPNIEAEKDEDDE
jgi:PIN like domain